MTEHQALLTTAIAFTSLIAAMLIGFGITESRN